MTEDPELARLRAAIDELNSRLCTLLHERARLCRRIGAWKRGRGLVAVDPKREQAMLAAALAGAPADGLPAPQLEQVLRALFAASRPLVERPET